MLPWAPDKRGGGGGVLKLHTDVSQQNRQTEQHRVNKLHQNPRTLFSMYIKFWRSYGEDKKDEAGENLSPESKLSVELEQEKGKLTGRNPRLYRAACFLLTIICLALLLAVIILSVKLQTGSTVCPEREETTPTGRRNPPFAPTCSHEECQALFPNIQPQRLSCRQCADGWLTLGSSCFYLSTSRLSWDESQRNCTGRGGALAVVNSRSVQNFLTKKGRMKYWIGLRHEEAMWTWVDKSGLRESYWADVTSDGDCGILSSERPPEKNWIKGSCDAYAYYICQLQF